MKHTKTALTMAVTLGISLSAQAQDSDADEQSSVEEVVVIGSKTNTSRQDLSSSLGYFSSERINSEPILNIEDIFDRTANAFTGTASLGAYSIRGVNNNGIVGSLNNSNALASIVVNNVALGLTSGDYIKPSMFDVESVEILRGPQSAVQGPNSLIGAVYVNYARPEFDNTEGRIRLEAGALDTNNISFMQNAELLDDRIAARIVLEKRDVEGDAINTTTGAQDVQRTDEELLRLMFRFQPRSDDSLIFDLTYIQVDSDSNPFGLMQAPPGGTLFDRQQPINVEDQYPADFSQISFEADWLINDQWSFKSITGANDIEITQRFDGDLTQFDFLAVDGIVEEDLFSQEFRLNFTGDRIDALFGLFYSDGDYLGGFAGTGIFPDGMGGVMPFNTTSRYAENIEQLALFSKVSWRFADRWNADFGLRLNNEDRSNINFADNNGIVSDLAAGESFDQVIPSLALSYDLTTETTIGVSYAEGFQAGGIAFAVFLGLAAPYDEEFTDNYEIFVRHQTADGRFVINANLFYVDWADQQVSFTLPGGIPGFDDHVANAGESTIQGLELEAEWRATDNISAYMSLGMVDTEFETFVLNGVDVAGSAFPQSPDYNVALGLNFEPGTGWYGSGTLTYVDSTFTEIAAPEITAVGERLLLSGRFGYQTQNWRAYIWGTNLLDEDYEVGLFDGTLFGLGGAYGRISQPQTIGIGAQFTW